MPKPETINPDHYKFIKAISAVDYRGLLKRDCGTWADDEQIDQMVKVERERTGEPRGPLDCALKPHGRKAWNLYLEHGCKVDLSVMPRINDKDHHRFQTWFTDWRGVFANETQALAIFNAAQPENAPALAASPAGNSNEATDTQNEN